MPFFKPLTVNILSGLMWCLVILGHVEETA